MDNVRGTVIHFDYGGYYSDRVVWNHQDDKTFSIVTKGTLEDVTYDRLVDRICTKLRVDAATTKLQLSYVPLIVHPKSPSYILDDEDVLGYLMEVNQDHCRSLLHVELSEVVSEKQSSQYIFTNEEMLSDGKVNDDDIFTNEEMLNGDYPGSLKTPSAKELVGLVQRRVGVKVSYSTALRGKKKASDDVRGSPDESFYMLPAYLHMLERMNPGTVTKVEVDEQQRFKYLFIAVGACIEGFRSMRKVIIIDGTHLKNVYGGVLVIACAQDPDRHHYPLAFRVVDAEKDDSWRWFLNMLKTQIPDDPELVFVSDRHQSIIKTVHEVYPRSAHGYCIYHLSQNVKEKVYGVRKDRCAERFRECAQIYEKHEFARVYADFCNTYEAARVYLKDSVHLSRWARSHFPGKRYNIDTTNCVESMNNVLLEARKLSLLPMIDEILGKIIEWFNKYRNEAAKVPQNQLVVPRVQRDLDNMCEAAKKLHVVELNSFQQEYKVGAVDESGCLVDLIKKSCGCNHFDIDRYPCVHVIAVIDWITKHRDVEIDLREYCSKYYWMEQWVLAYHRTIYPVPHHLTWEVSPEILEEIVLPKHYVPKKGRPQVTRFPSAGESRKKKKKPSSWFEQSGGGENLGC